LYARHGTLRKPTAISTCTCLRCISVAITTRLRRAYDASPLHLYAVRRLCCCFCCCCCCCCWVVTASPRRQRVAAISSSASQTPVRDDLTKLGRYLRFRPTDRKHYFRRSTVDTGGSHNGMCTEGGLKCASVCAPPLSKPAHLPEVNTQLWRAIRHSPGPTSCQSPLRTTLINVA